MLVVFAALNLPAAAFAWFAPFQSKTNAADIAAGSVETCVSQEKKVGETITAPSGVSLKITDLVSASPRCLSKDLPNLAHTDFQMLLPGKAGIDLPEGYELQPLSDAQKYMGIVLAAKNSTADSIVLVSIRAKELTPDIFKYAKELRSSQSKPLINSHHTPPEQQTRNGISVWTYETIGKLHDAVGTKYTFEMTLVEGDRYVVAINVGAPTNYFSEHQNELKAIPTTIVGVGAARFGGN